jgi:hypothetical protein
MVVVVVVATSKPPADAINGGTCLVSLLNGRVVKSHFLWLGLASTAVQLEYEMFQGQPWRGICFRSKIPRCPL